jgi:hypothetical protein
LRRFEKDAWGALSEYLKHYNRFPQPFLDWFSAIFQVYHVKDESGERVVSLENILRLYAFSGLEKREATHAFAQLTAVNKL